LLSLRVEKGYGSWGREYSPEYWPHEVGLERLIKMDKPEFLGKEVWAELQKTEPREKLVLLSIDVVAVLGLPHHARLLDEPPFDPKGEKLRN